MQGDAVFRKSEDIGGEPEVAAMKFDDQDVSDIEEEDEEQEMEDDIDRRHDDLRRTVIEAPRPRGRSDVSPVRESETMSPGRPPDSDALSDRPIASSPTAPSPFTMSTIEVYSPHKTSQERSRASVTTSILLRLKSTPMSRQSEGSMPAQNSKARPTTKKKTFASAHPSTTQTAIRSTGLQRWMMRCRRSSAITATSPQRL